MHPRTILVNDRVNESFQQTIKDRLKVLGVKTVLGMSFSFSFVNIVHVKSTMHNASILQVVHVYIMLSTHTHIQSTSHCIYML